MRVKPGTTPSTGWGNVKASSVGTVKEITDGGEKCKIDFPEQSGWVGVIAELEIAVSATCANLNLTVLTPVLRGCVDVLCMPSPLSYKYNMLPFCALTEYCN